MKKSLKKKLHLITLLALFSVSAFGQHGNPLQFFTNISQVSQVNPAFQNKTEKLVVGLPIIGGTRVNWNANFSIADFHTNDFAFDYKNLYDALSETGDAFSIAQVPLIYLSLKNKNNTYSFSIAERFIGTTNFNPEILNFFAKGLLPYYNSEQNLGTIDQKAHYFREISFSYAHEIKKIFSAGVRTKIMFDKFFHHLDNINISVETQAEQEQLLVNPDGKITVSGPLKITNHSSKGYVSVEPNLKFADYLFSPKNMGFAVDFGFTYKLDKRSEISSSIRDLGFTSMKFRSYSIVFNDALRYPKDSLYQSHAPSHKNYTSPEDALTSMRDSIEYITDLNSFSQRQYDPLPIHFTIQIKRKLNNYLQFGAANNFTYYKNHSSNYLSGFIRSHLNDKFEAVTTLSLYNFERIMPGIGINYTGQSAQFYFSTNNILELVQTTSSKNLNLLFGVNFLFSTD